MAQKTISIHSLVKRETAVTTGNHKRDKNFNPLPRKEGDAVANGMAGVTQISIHSLVKRETTSTFCSKYRFGAISIHSLVKRETLTIKNG